MAMDPLQNVEIICARLYTAPMYCKYNTVLRDIGHLRSKHSSSMRSTQSAKEISTELDEYQKQKEKEAKETRKNDQIECTTTEGVGKKLRWTVTIKTQYSDGFHIHKHTSSLNATTSLCLF